MKPAPPRVDTPLGAVTFVAQAGRAALAQGPRESWRFHNGTGLSRWRTDSVDVELLLGQIEAQVPAHFLPVTLWAAMWRFAARHPISGLHITAALTDAPPDVVGGPDSGEHVDAVTLENATAVVSIGGPDTELLKSLAGSELPARWQSMEWGAEYVDNATLSWHLPDLRPAETAELTIAVAWSAPTDDPATWYAVDLAPGSALARLSR